MGPDAVTNVMNKILGKGPQEKHSVILSKGLTDKVLLKRKIKQEKDATDDIEEEDTNEPDEQRTAAAKQRVTDIPIL